jgi:uncharacterized protein (TIRG00374 family)
VAGGPAEAGLGPRGRGRFSWIWLGARVVLTGLAVFLIVRIVDWGAFVETIGGVRPGWLALAYLMFLAERLLMSVKWGILLRDQEIELPLWENWCVYSLAGLLGMVLPATVGSDAMRVGWLWRRGHSGSKATASVILERAIGFVIWLAIATLGLVYLAYRFPEQEDLKALAALAGASLGVVGIGFLVTIRMEWSSGGAEDPGKIPSWLTTRVKKLHAAYTVYRRRPSGAIRFSLLTLVEQILFLLMFFVLAVALRIEVDPLHFCAALAAASLVHRLPITVDGLGVYEGVLILLLSMAGVPNSGAVAVAVVGRIVNILAFAPGAVLASVTLGPPVFQGEPRSEPSP